MSHKPFPTFSQADLEHLIACPECDVLHDKRDLAVGQSACCRRCHAVLYRHKPAGIQQAAALSLAALLLYGIANVFPFMAIEAQGQLREISLLSCITELYQHQMPGLALFTFAILLCAPLLRIVSLLYVLLPLGMNRRWRYAMALYRLAEWLKPWSMAEIHLLGTLVALIKLAAMGTMILGVAFWGLMALVLTLTTVRLVLDDDTVWHRLEHAPSSC